MAAKSPSKIILHYGIDWCVFSASDRYCEHAVYRSRDRSRAQTFARAWNKWVRGGCVLDGNRPLGMSDDGTVYRQRDFDARRTMAPLAA